MWLEIDVLWVIRGDEREKDGDHDQEAHDHQSGETLGRRARSLILSPTACATRTAPEVGRQLPAPTTVFMSLTATCTVPNRGSPAALGEVLR